ncbi:GNAT family N-acetyltransferase [Virgibacillus flavescens]|uniref:GNAT family N-acetyltransferase n=1 Tax=Virgibacillus flavescens TaxID=1611422 RepID=UPI003D3368C2
MKQLKVRPFTIEYQEEAKKLVLEGMKERFGFIDHTLNPDLNDILNHYLSNGNSFFIGFINKELVCTGALTSEGSSIVRIERMSVKRSFRRCGIAQSMLEYLERQVKQEDYRTIVLETNQEWKSAINFYEKNGFNFDFQDKEQLHFIKKID